MFIMIVYEVFGIVFEGKIKDEVPKLKPFQRLFYFTLLCMYKKNSVYCVYKGLR